LVNERDKSKYDSVLSSILQSDWNSNVSNQLQNVYFHRWIFLQRLEALTGFMSWKVRTDSLPPDLDLLKRYLPKILAVTSTVKNSQCKFVKGKYGINKNR